MLNPALACLCVLMIALASCSTAPHRNLAHAPDWEDTLPGPAVVPPGPVIAPPASAMPELSSNTVASERSPRPSTRPETNGASGPATNGMLASRWSAAYAGNTWVSLPRWCQATGLATLSRLTSSSSPGYALRSAEGVLILHPGTVVSHWEGIELRLGFAPQMIGDQPYIHALDLEKTIVPLFKGGAGGTLFKGPIVIDPGHGGEDAGASSVAASQREKELALDWALRLRSILTAKGYQVLLTRSTDANLPLSERVAVAATQRAGLFLSLHFNSAAPDRTQAGLETYCLTPAGMPSSLTRGYPDDLRQTFPNNAFDAQNLLLAVQVHRQVLQVNGHQDRGVRRARFPAVLRGQRCPAVLIEGGYLSNPSEARWIAMPAHRQELAEAVARAVASGLCEEK